MSNIKLFVGLGNPGENMRPLVTMLGTGGLTL